MAPNNGFGSGGAFHMTTNVTISTKAKAFANVTRNQLRNASFELGERAKQYAQANVAKGKGPSSHPHEAHRWHNFKWQDTGDLADSVQVRYRQAGFLRTVTVYTNSDYGMYLELGFRGPSGRLYRYPWLRPAYMKAQKEVPLFATQALKRAIEETNRASSVIYDEKRIKTMIEDFDAHALRQAEIEFDKAQADKKTLKSITKAVKHVHKPPKNAPRRSIQDSLDALHKSAPHIDFKFTGQRKRASPYLPPK